MHRGTKQIGGVATEIRTASTRIIVDMGDELSLDPGFTPTPLHIPGVTDTNGCCDGILLTHYHGDHFGQLGLARSEIPIYMGGLTQAVLLKTIRHEEVNMLQRVQNAGTFTAGCPFSIGDIQITPYCVDHSACDSYMFLIEGDGKRILHTGDFRMHGFRGKALPTLLDKRIGRVDALITEGTTLSREAAEPMTEKELQRRVKEYLAQYKYVFALCASTNLERICAFSKAVPRGKYFICDKYQAELLDLFEYYYGANGSPWYRNIKKTVYGDNILNALQERGFLMTVRDNRAFRKIIARFDRSQSVLLYSMWDGYRTKPGSTIPDFLALAGRWEPLHTSGHASHEDIRQLIQICDPKTVIPIHSDRPDRLKALCPERCVASIRDGEELTV